MCEIIGEIERHRLIGILRGVTLDIVDELGAILFEGGLRVVEVTCDNFQAPEMIRRLRAISNEWYVGAGTVLDEATGRSAIAAGAQFLVTPTVREDVIRTGRRYGKPVIIGAMTPTEVLTAYEMGSSLVKVFPAACLGPRYIQQLRGPLPNVPLVAVGGIDSRNARLYLDAGCVAVGVGSALVPRLKANALDLESVRSNVQELVAAVS